MSGLTQPGLRFYHSQGWAITTTPGGVLVAERQVGSAIRVVAAHTEDEMTRKLAAITDAERATGEAGTE